MSSQEEEEEMMDNFEDEEEQQPSTFPFSSTSPNAPANKPTKPLLEEYREVRQAEEAQHSAEREYLEHRLRVCLAQDPKIEIGKASVIQEKTSNMTIEQLRFAVQAAEDKLGISAPQVLPKAALKMVEKGINMAGIALKPTAFEDKQFLGVIGRYLPVFSWKYGDLVQLAVQFMDYLEYQPHQVLSPPVMEGYPPLTVPTTMDQPNQTSS